MRKTITTIFIIIIVISSNALAGAYGGGSGTEADPFLISDPNHMQGIGADPNDWDKHFLLTNDIDLGQFTGTEFNVIGNSISPFTGVFNGNSFSINNFTYNSDQTDHIGLFGIVNGVSAEIKDIKLIDFYIDANTGNYIGSIVGELEEGIVSSCRVETGRVFGASTVGGLVGRNSGIIQSCYSEAFVNGQIRSGVLVGDNIGVGKIADCQGDGKIVAIDQAEDIGGLVGYNSGSIASSRCNSDVTAINGFGQIGGFVGDNGASVLDCFVTGEITTGNALIDIGLFSGFNSGSIRTSWCEGTIIAGNCEDIGGMAGNNIGYLDDCFAKLTIYAGETSFQVGGLVGDNDGHATNCYSVSSVQAGNRFGCLVGDNSFGDMAGCFWEMLTLEPFVGVGHGLADGSTGLEIHEMKSKAEYLSAGWDFVDETLNGTDNYWRLCSNGVDYPQLAWQSITGDIACPHGVNLFDLAFLSSRWMEMSCETSNNCGGADIDKSGSVDIEDLRSISTMWLEDI